MNIIKENKQENLMAIEEEENTNQYGGNDAGKYTQVNGDSLRKDQMSNEK